jgi:hypothetical protein
MDAIEARELKENVLRIMALAMEVSKIREDSDEGGYPDVFVSFSGHVSDLDVHVYENGFDDKKDPDRQWYVHLYEDDTEDLNKTMFHTFGRAELDNIIEYLEDLKNAKL